MRKTMALMTICGSLFAGAAVAVDGVEKAISPACTPILAAHCIKHSGWRKKNEKTNFNALSPSGLFGCYCI